MPIKRTNLEIHEVSLCKRGANQGAKVVLAKSMENDVMPNTVEELEKQIADLMAERDSLKAEIAKATSAKSEDDEKLLIVQKADPELRAMIEKAQADAAAAREDAKKNAEALAKAQREVLEKMIVDRLEKMKEVLGGEEDRTAVLKMTVEMTPEQREAALKLFEKANTLASKGVEQLSKEHGDSRSQTGLTAEQEIEKLAGELVSKEGMTIHKARTKVREGNPELAKREAAELKERK